jgi:hypothetical protein
VLQTVDHIEISYLGAPFSLLEKPRNLMGARSGLHGRCSNWVPPIHFFPSRTQNSIQISPHAMIAVLGFDSRRGLGIFPFATMSRTDLEPTQPPTQCVLGGSLHGVNRPGREADLSPPSSVEVKNACSYISTPPIRLHGVVLKHMTTLTFIFTFIARRKQTVTHRRLYLTLLNNTVCTAVVGYKKSNLMEK